MKIQFRVAKKEDLDFMKKMLYEAVYWRSSSDKPSFEDGLALEGVLNAIIDWGKSNDIAVIAMLNGEKVGAAWFRTYTELANIRGYIDSQTPVLVAAVEQRYRRQGIAKKMIKRLIEKYKDSEFDRLSLCVSKDNHALRLYHQLGFVEAEDIGDSLIMIYSLK